MIQFFKKPETAINYLFAIVAFTIPLPMLINNIAIIFLVLGICIVLKSDNIKKIRWNYFFILSSIFFLQILGLLYPDLNSNSYKYIERNLVFFLMPFFFLSYQKKVNLRIVLLAFSICVSILCFICLTNIVVALLKHNSSNNILWDITNKNLAEKVGLEPIYFSIYILLSNLYLISKYFNSKRKNYILILVVNSIILILLGSRNITVSYVFLSAIVLAFFLNKKRLPLRNIFLIIGAFLLFLFSIAYLNPVIKWRYISVFNTTSLEKNMPHYGEKGARLRKQLWASAIEIVSKNPILGVGTGSHTDELKKTYLENKYRIPFRKELITHNQYLTYAVMFGCVGLLIFVVYVAFFIKYFYKNKLLLPLLFLISIICICITESFLYVNKGIVFFAFFSNLFLINHFHGKKTKSPIHISTSSSSSWRFIDE